VGAERRSPPPGRLRRRRAAAAPPAAGPGGTAAAGGAGEPLPAGGRSTGRREALGLLALLGAAAAAGPALALGPRLALEARPAHPQPGDVVLVRVPRGPADLAGEWGGRPLRFFPGADERLALAGVDLDTPAGPLRWRLTRPGPDGTPRLAGEGQVTVRGRSFETQRLTLPSRQVDLDPATLARVQAEQAELRAALQRSAAERLWAGRFRPPVAEGRPTGGFGLRRLINGQPRSPHAGFDWAAPTGTPVTAANAGRVALVGEHFFAGRLVVLDHGLGLHTLYFHLDAAQVAAGDPVAAGQALGTVGATGRVTGPHLHFAVVLDGARVDPESLLRVSP
jgi:hypothetical protein